jgi:hypothetical protein
VSPGYIASLILAGLTVVGTFVAFFVLLFVGAIGGLGESAKYGGSTCQDGERSSSPMATSPCSTRST